MVLNLILGSLAILSLLLMLWQWVVARRFPLHQRAASHSFPPALTLLKPLKGVDAETEACLRSWFAQDYTGRLQILFGVSSKEDPVCPVVQKLIQEFPNCEAQLRVCSIAHGANAKVSKLMELEAAAKHDILVISDADVRVPPDFLANAIEPLRQASGPNNYGLVNSFYILANPSTVAMHWEAVAINADFWSQVLQSQSIKPIDFALGAVMLVRREQLKQIGGFKSLVDCLADDYQLGHRIARLDYRIAICPIVVECWGAPMGWREVWKHQLRWARTIRVCQPLPYFFSILSNASLWPILWLAVNRGSFPAAFCLICLLVRIGTAVSLQARLTRTKNQARWFWLVPIKDILQTAIWLLAFLGNQIEWRGERMRLRRDGTLVKATRQETLQRTTRSHTSSTGPRC